MYEMILPVPVHILEFQKHYKILGSILFLKTTMYKVLWYIHKDILIQP